MADYNPNQFMTGAEIAREEESRKRHYQDAAYETYKDNIEFSLGKRLDDLKDRVQATFDRAEYGDVRSEEEYAHDLSESQKSKESHAETAQDEPSLYEYTVTYRVLALNPLHAVTLVPQAQNIEVRLVPYVHA